MLTVFNSATISIAEVRGFGCETLAVYYRKAAQSDSAAMFNGIIQHKHTAVDEMPHGNAQGG